MADWTEIRITVPADDVDRAGDITQMVVPYGIYIEDYRTLEQEAWEIARIDLIDEDLLAKDRSKGIIHVYISPEENPAEAVSFLRERFEAENIDYEIDETICKNADWENNWKKYFKPFDVGSRLVVKPTWEKYDNSEGKVILEIDPGNVFGSGSHETTKMCLEALDEYIKGGEKILDIGCGSGILSVGGLLLGADHAELIDIDKNAAAAADANMKLNKIPAERYNSAFGDILEDREFDASYQGKNFDCVVANIVADIIIALSEMVPKYLKNGGIFISSGIISEREEDVRESLIANGFQIIEMKEMGNWRAFVTRFSLEE